ncbi:hypothetical protein HG535_0B01230 [Zygotorulaspora mrakii]|uniref:mRNA-capping enzyme subunit beta n=1 Tax=Zygotorulaspora mrakii TaxID=42260 RepID=A0A7H9AXH2_ZYGMR|nr:uncharacterized protein HG535_0B01230 [Zygotorulaspora mrakii]QLG71085.1 hypothetical protein HG535_0B01230 [Zygotorulaspora mrakii]
MSTSEQSRQQPKRALSLDDLVNHDENPKVKSPNYGQNNESVSSLNSSEIRRETSVNSINPNDFMGDETDTDDDVGMGGGGVNFDKDMTFDYDKQEGKSPQKDESKRATEQKNTLLAAPQEPKSSLIEKKNPSTSRKTSDAGTAASTNTFEPQGSENSVTTIFDERASLKSRKNNLKKDLQILNEIAATSKPNKYKNVPIWAQKWRPTIKALQNIDKKDFKIDNSFLNIIPDDDLTKSVQDWVYATIFSIPPDMRQLIEMEMKFGVIMDAKSPDRINPPVSSQAVFTELDTTMVPTIDPSVFEELKKYIRGLSEVSENRGKFSTIESHTKDSTYRVGVATQRPRFLRMSTDIKTGRVGQFIEKRKIAHLLIYSPKDSYDVKISINLEIPVPENEPPEKYKSQTPLSERSKERVSYIHNDSCTRIDITKVEKSEHGRKGSSPEITHEIELEINTPALLKAFDSIATDSQVYASVIRTFLNNGTIIRRKLTSLSYAIFEGQKKGM